MPTIHAGEHRAVVVYLYECPRHAPMHRKWPSHQQPTVYDACRTLCSAGAFLVIASMHIGVSTILPKIIPVLLQALKGGA